MDTLELEVGEYYRINNTKKILYWGGEKWMKPRKDQQGKFGSWVGVLDKQPTNVKSVEHVPYHLL